MGGCGAHFGDCGVVDGVMVRRLGRSRSRSLGLGLGLGLGLDLGLLAHMWSGGVCINFKFNGWLECKYGWLWGWAVAWLWRRWFTRNIELKPSEIGSVCVRKERRRDCSLKFLYEIDWETKVLLTLSILISISLGCFFYIFINKFYFSLFLSHCECESPLIK